MCTSSRVGCSSLVLCYALALTVVNLSSCAQCAELSTAEQGRGEQRAGKCWCGAMSYEGALSKEKRRRLIRRIMSHEIEPREVAS